MTSTSECWVTSKLGWCSGWGPRDQLCQNPFSQYFSLSLASIEFSYIPSTTPVTRHLMYIKPSKQSRWITHTHSTFQNHKMITTPRLLKMYNFVPVSPDQDQAGPSGLAATKRPGVRHVFMAIGYKSWRQAQARTLQTEMFKLHAKGKRR